MITDLTYDDFCKKYFLEARRAADVTVANFIKENGQPHRSIDLELVKDSAMVYALRKAYDRFDSDNEKAASVETFLSVIIHNQVMTELRKEGRAVGADRTQSLDESYYEGGEQTETDSNNPLDNSAEMAQMRSRVTECIGRLDQIDQVIIICWMENKRSYCDEALSKLGWGEEKRDEVKARKKNAFDQLQGMLNEYGPDRKGEDARQIATGDFPKKSRETVNVYTIPLKNLNYYVDYIREYFGLFHPALDPELALLDRDPDRTFELKEFVLHEDIETAFDEGLFTYEEESKRVYADLLWLVANLYCYDFYQQYQNYFAEMVSDDLMWDETYDDILHFYAFMQDHKVQAPIELKIGKEKIVIKDTGRWFQALMDNHLFPKCCPEIRSKEEVIEKFKKSAGRKVENKLAVAIINGIARFFADTELIKGQAPKNLCSFIRQYLILMEILDLDYRVISETSIKSAINYASKRGGDSRLPSTELKEVTLEELKQSGFNPGERWLYSTEE